MRQLYKPVKLWLKRAVRRRTFFNKVQIAVLLAFVAAGTFSAFVYFQQVSAVGTTYYVDCDTGSNSNTGTSEGAALLDLSKFDGSTSTSGEINLVAGDRLLLKRGCTFTGKQIQADWDGTANDRIVIDAYGTGAMPIVKDAPVSNYNTCNRAGTTCIANQGSTLVSLTGSYITIQNIEFTLTPETKLRNHPTCTEQHVGNHFGINLSGDSSYNIVQNSKFSKFEAGVHFANGDTPETSPRFNKILNNTIVDNSAIHPNVEPNDTITYIGAWGINLKGFDNEIAYNYFADNRELCLRDSALGIIYESNTIEIFAALRNHIHHNVSVNERVFSEIGSAYVAAGQTRNTAFDSADNVIAYNTVFSNLDVTRFITLHALGTNNSPVYNTQIINNTIYYTSTTDTQAIVCMGCTEAGLTLKNNIIYTQKKAIYVGNTSQTINEENNIFWNATGTTNSQFFQNYTRDPSSQFVNPKFVDPANLNFRLAADSPARDAGLSLTSLMTYNGTAYDTTDVGGVAVPQNGTVDIGSNEYPVSTATSSATTYVQDSFSRTTTGGWGTADTGGNYTGSPSSGSSHSTNGSSGLFYAASCNSTLQQNLTTVSSLHTDMLVKVKSDKASTSENQNIYVTLRKQTGVNYEYRPTLQFSNGAVKMWAGKLTGSNTNNTIGSSFTHGTLTHSADTWYWWRVQAYGTNPTTIRMKIWQDGTSEPASWNVTVTDSEATLQNAGSVGLRSFLPGTCTSAPLTISFDDFSVKSMSAPVISPVYQKQANCSDDLAIGGSVNGDSFCASATLSDADDPDSLQLEVEVQPITTAFTNVPTATGSAVAASGGSPVTGSVVVSGLSVGSGYHWQARALDSLGNTSSWLSFGNNTETSADFSTVTLPTVAFTTTSSSGVEATVTRNIGVSLSHSVAQPVTVEYAVTGGTATGSGTDYTLSSGVATISANTTTTNIPVSITHDGWDESDETVIITLSNPTNATLGANTTHTHTITDDDTTGFLVDHSGGSTNVTEGSTTDTYTVRLTSRPTTNVTVTPTVDSQVTVSPTSLTFSSGNWYTNQTITVTAVDDASAEGNHSTTITHAATSSDATYNGFAVGSITANITDNDSPGISVTESSAATAVTEGGATDSYTVVLTTLPTSDVTVNISGDSQVSLSASSLTFTTSNWSSAQTVTVTAANDDVVEGEHTSTISHTSSSSDANYNNRTISSVTTTITDNDTAGVTVTESGGSTAATEGGTTDTYTVTLTSEPTSDVTVTLTAGADLSLSASTLTFTSANWDTAQTVTVTAANDSIDEDSESATITHTVTSSDSNYTGISADSVTVAVTDNDTAGFTVTETSGNTAVTEGGATDEYTIVLNTQPTNGVLVTMIGSEVSLVNENDENPITFTTDNWSTPQTVTVTATDDSDVEGAHSDSITHAVASLDSKYDDFSIATISASITDNDNAGVSVTESTGTAVAEGGATDSYTVALTNAPSADVTIAVTGDADASVSPTSLTFTTSNWSVAQTVTVTATDDNIVEDSHTATITHAATSSDSNYNGITISSVTATVSDNDSVGVTIVQSSDTTTVTEGGATDSYTFTLNSQPTNDVTITLAGTQVSPSPSSLVFTAENWSTAQTVSVTATDDSSVEGSHSGSVSHTATSSDSAYNGISISNVSVTITDNDTAAVTITESNDNTAVAEGGTTDTYTVVLTSQPTANVSISLSGSQVSVSPTSLTFTTSNWSSAQTVTVTATNDASIEGAHTGTVTHTATSTDDDYNGISISSLTVDVTDNDTAGITLNESAGATNVTEGGSTDSYSIVLNTQPSANVSVTLTTNSQVSLSASSLTFTDLNWDTPQTVTVTASNDSVVEGAHSTTISHTVSSSDNNYEGATVPAVTVNITDNDTAGVTVTQSSGTTAVTEGGATDSYTVVLTSQPASDVSIAVSSTSDVSLSASTLTFTSSNWSSAQTITVTAVNDSIDEDAETADITHTATSSDSNYNGITVSSVTASVTDNDTASITLTESSSTTAVAEGSTTDTYTIVLGTQPTADVTVALSTTTQVNLSASTLTFTSSNWSSAQTITVTANDDDVVEGSHPAVIAHAVTSDDTKFNNMSVSNVSVTITDNDTADIIVTESGGSTTVTEGGATDSYSFELTSQPTVEVVISITAGTGLSLSSSTVTLNSTNWNTPQTVTVSGTDDQEYTGNRTATLSHTVASEDLDYDGDTLSNITVNITEDDTPNIIIAETDGTRVNENAGTDTYTVRLNGEPTANVIVTPTASSSQITVAPETLTFTTANWETAQTVTITGVDDANKEGTHTATITHTTASSDTAFHAVSAPSVTVTINDDDQININVDSTDGGTEVTEGGDSWDEYKVSLSTEPTSDVVITLTVPDGISTDKNKLTFTRANWTQQQGVRITANDDNTVESEQEVKITHVVKSDDGRYNDMGIGEILVKVKDNDRAGVVATTNINNQSLTEGGRSLKYDIVLTSRPSADVTVKLTTNSQVTINGATYKFTADNWDTPQTVTVFAINDEQPEAVIAGIINYTVTSSDATYNNLAVERVVLTVIDNDGVGTTRVPTIVSTLDNEESISAELIAAADLDSDGDVNQSDLAILQANWMKQVDSGTPLLGDINIDGVVDLSDISLLARAWGLEL